MTMLTREAQISTDSADRIYCCKEKYSFRINCQLVVFSMRFPNQPFLLLRTLQCAAKTPENLKPREKSRTEKSKASRRESYEKVSNKGAV